LFRKRMAGMDGSAAIRRRSVTRRSASNANDSRKTLSARGAGIMAGDNGF
jgi:hypothetical protein